MLGSGSGATAEFRISRLSTVAPAGATLAYLQFSAFPGYNDGYLTVPLSKVEPKPAIVFFDGTPTYVGALGEKVSLQWQTTHVARVELYEADRRVEKVLEPGQGTFEAAVDRTVEFTLKAFTSSSDTSPVQARQWTCRVPDARITRFTVEPSPAVARSAVTLDWATEFARAARISAADQAGGTTTHDIPAPDVASPTTALDGKPPRTFYPMHPTTYTLRIDGEGNPPESSVKLLVLQRGWAVRRMGFSPDAGQGPVLLATDDGLVLLGGQSPNAIFQSPDGTRWSMAGTASFPARNHAAGCALGDRLWIMGGLQRSPDGRDIPRRDVWSSTSGLEWAQVTASAAWPSRSRFACVAFKDRLWAIGGMDQNLQPLGDVWSSADGAEWTQAGGGAARWSPRSDPAVAVHDGRIWLFGGRTGDGTADDELWSSADGATWQQVRKDRSGPWPEAREQGTLMSSTAALTLFGGADRGGKPLNDLHLFDGNGWELGTGPTAWATNAAGACVWQGVLWFAGGSVSDGATDEVWSWFPE